MLTFSTFGKYGYGIKFSNRIPHCLAATANESFGLSGKGTLFILQIQEGISIEILNIKYWHESLFDVAWSESLPNNLITGAGDGHLQLWDIYNTDTPTAEYSGHKREISSVRWSKYRDQFISTSWDSSIKVWDLNRSSSVNTFYDNCNIIHCVCYSKCSEDLFASVSENGNLKIWNSSMAIPACTLKAHDAQALYCDWNSFSRHLIATCGNDGLVRGWDIRYYTQPVFQMKDSNVPTKVLHFSPHYSNILATGSFDFSTKIWNISDNLQPLEVSQHHSEFIHGLDWNVHRKGEIGACSWDKCISVFTPTALRNLRHKL